MKDFEFHQYWKPWKKKKFALISLISLVFLITKVYGLSQLLGTISVDDTRVSQVTTFKFDLISTQETVASGDFLEIRLSEDLDATFSSGSPTCRVTGASISRCVIVDQRICRITFSTRMSTTQISGSVSGFKNPKSNRLQDNIQIALFNSFGEQRTTTFTGSLPNFDTVTLDGSLISSSDVVGDKNAVLTISVTPETVLAGIGILVVNFPEYYENAGSDQMIGSTSPACSSSKLRINACSFNSASRILTIEYETSDGSDTSSSHTFLIRSFKNPVKPETKRGFTLIATDSLGYAIAESEQLSLVGVSDPTTFDYVVFSFDDTAIVGQYSTFRIEIGMATSLDRQCFVKIDFPSDFGLDNQLINVFASGFLRPSSGSSVSLFERNLSSGIFSFEACQRGWGSDPTGSLVFQRVKNPAYIRDTGTFKVYVSADADFDDLIAFKTSGLEIEGEQLQGGQIENIRIEAQDTMIEAETAYNFHFSPDSSIDTSTVAKITIEFPSTLSIDSNRCSILSRSSAFSNSMSCNLSGRVITLSYVFANKPDFVGGTSLSVTISTFTNPSYVTEVGAFTISTYIKVDNVYYLQDRTTTRTNLITFNPGSVTRTRDVTSSSYQASKDNAIYVFSTKMEHKVPVNGRIRIVVPSQIQINESYVTKNCYRLDYSQVPISLDCSVNSDNNYIDVIVRSRTFGSSGLPAGQDFRLQVAGLKNPREVNAQVAFIVETFDSSERLIDESTGAQSFVIAMQEIGYFQSMSVETQSPVNGATSAYRFEIIPSMQIGYGDVLYITFPKEVQLPSSYYVQCKGSKSVEVSSCVKANAREIRITLTEIADDFDPLDPFYVYVLNCLNPVALKPSGVFSDIKLVSRYGNDIARYYSDNLYIETSVKAEIEDMRLSQSTLYPGEEAFYTIQFTLTTRLPSTTAFRVKTPRQIEVVRAEKKDCYIDSNRKVTGVCTYKGDDQVDLIRGLNHMGSADFDGQIMIVFKAINPQSNFYQGIEIIVEVSLDSSFKYPIASIQGGLAASFECNYPCLSCNPFDPDDCESCPDGVKERQFLQENVFTKKKTCMSQCELGYTWDKTVAKVCFPCDPSCATCRQGGELEDRRMCNSCAPNYSYQWVEEAKCFADELGCPDGTYEYTKKKCRQCDQDCQICSSASSCERCDAFSQTPLLQNEGCVSKCFDGKTPIYTDGYGECVNCNDSCATCKDGNPDFCLTCAAGDKQFLFGGQCLEACPEGTTRDLITSKCIGCKQGCIECDLEDNSICLRCASGLSLFESRCRIECPVDYQKSADGTICEPRIYPFDHSFVPFPFIIMLGSLYVITIFCWILTKRRTLILQGFIISTTIVMQLAVVFSLLKAMAEGQALFITFNILVLIANVLLGVAFSITFHLQIDDYQFNEWREANGKAYKVMRLFFTFFSLHLFRIQYCKIFKLNAFQASATIPHEFVRPIRLYSKLHIGIIMIPIFVLNLFGMIFTFDGFWDNQLQMTMFEQVIMVPLQILMIMIEIIRVDPRALLHKPSDENPFFISMFEEKPIDGDKDFDPKSRAKKRKRKQKRSKKRKMLGAAAPSTEGEGDETEPMSYWDLTDKKIRCTQLTNIIRTVKSHADINLNNKLDEIINLEGEQYDKEHREFLECESCPDLHHGQEKVVPCDQDILNLSFPGLNQQMVDPNAKRCELFAWFKEMADADAERERKLEAEILRRQMQVDAACMHDTELVDNCFFTSKEKVVAQAQTVPLELIDQAVSAKTMQTNAFKVDAGGRSDVTSIAEDEYDTNGEGFPEIKSQAANKVKALSGLQGDTERGLLADQMASERAKPTGNEELFEGELMDADQGADLQLCQIYDKLGNKLKQKVISKRAIFRLQKAGKKIVALGNVFRGLNSGEGARFESLQEGFKVDEDDESIQLQLRNFDSKDSDNMSRTLSKNSHSQGLELESKHARDSFRYDEVAGAGNARTSDDEASGVEEVQSDGTGSTRKKTKRKLKFSIETKEMKLADFRKEPERPVNSKNWLAHAHRIQTIIIDEEVKAVMREPHPGLQLLENYGRSENTTEKTISGEESLRVSEKDRKNGGISEESYNEDDALFYKNNYPYDTHESISSVHTSEHEAISKMGTRNDFTEWMRDNVELNQRTFNVNDVIGNFPRNKFGRIINLREVVTQRNFRDFDGQLVNEQGYLINEVSGAIRSRYTYEDLMIGEFGNLNEIGELPMPYRLEMYNFNPHKIMGSFDYYKNLKTGVFKPTYLQNKFGGHTDKLFRPVNTHGFLINENCDIIDNEGRVKFTADQLLPAGGLPQLYTYSGQPYKISDIIGIFKKDDKSKQIILETDKATGKSVDLYGRLVNASGYLIDKQGNIVDQKGKKMFNFWEILFQEPPKIFEFMEFDINWIKGTLDRDVTKNPLHDDEYDLEGRLINTMGYLTDLQGNIVDQHGKLVFRRDILKQAYGQDAKIPAVFTMGILKKPQSTTADSDRTPNNIVYDQKVKDYDQSGFGGATGAFDETNVRSDGAPDAFSKSGNMSGVFSDTKSIAKQNSIALSNMSNDKGRRNNESALQEPVQLDIRIGSGGSENDRKNASPGIPDQPQSAQKKKQRSKSRQQQSAAQVSSGRQLRPAEKLLQNCYQNFTDGAKGAGMPGSAGPMAQQQKKKGRGNRPIRSALRNTRTVVTHQTVDSGAPKVIMQGYMGQPEQRLQSDYSAAAKDEIFGKSNQKAKQITQNLLKQQDQSLDRSLNQSHSGLLSNQLASATNLYRQQRHN